MARRPDNRNDTIEQSLKAKSTEVKTQQQQQLEKELREKYAKGNEVIRENFDLPSSEFVIDRMYISFFK